MILFLPAQIQTSATKITYDTLSHYNLWVVAFSYFLAVFGSFFAISILKAIQESNDARLRWQGITIGSLCMAVAIWSMHYTGMLSYRLPMRHNYDLGLTLLSCAVAIGFSLGFFYILTRPSLRIYHIVMSAPVLGLAISAMHYTGMGAMEMQADIYYRRDLFILSLVIAVLASAGAIGIMTYVSRLQRYRLAAQAVAALFMGLAVCGMHYTGMAATILVPFADCSLDSDENFLPLVSSVGLLSCTIIGLASYFLLYSRQNIGAKSPQIAYLFLSRLQYLSLALIVLIVGITSLFSYSIDRQFSPLLSRPEYASLKYIEPELYLMFCMLFPGIIALIIGIGAIRQGRKLLFHALDKHSFIQNMIDAIPDPIFVKDKDHVWKAGNKAFWKLMGGDSSAYIHKNDHDIFPPEEVAIFWEKDNQVIQSGIADTNEENVTGADGKTMIALTTKSPFTMDDGSRGLVGIIHDITAQKQAERELQKHRDNLQELVEQQTKEITEEKLTVTLLQNIATVANEAGSLLEAVPPILSLLCRYMDWPVGHVFLRDNNKREHFTDKIWHIQGIEQYQAFSRKMEAIERTSDQDALGRVLRSRKAYSIADIRKYPDYPNADLIAEYGLFTVVAFPIFFEGDVVAVLEFFSRTQMPISEDMLLLFDNIGSQLSVVVEREKTQMEMEKAVAAAERANQLKSEFLANMSHELRTPMHSIITFSRQGIERKAKWTSDQQAENLALIQESGERLLNLLNDLLDLSKLEANAVEYQFVEEQLNGLLAKALKQLHGLVQDKRLQVYFTPDEHLPNVICDSGKITQVIFNLLSNAIKFTPAGKAIHVACALDPEDPSSIITRICDEGVGIADKELETVFDKFVQGSKTKSGAGGTGLGLSICREIVNAHQGKIWAEHNQNQGACFYMRLPIIQSQA